MLPNVTWDSLWTGSVCKRDGFLAVCSAVIECLQFFRPFPVEDI
jgi:hypothetical protein